MLIFHDSDGRPREITTAHGAGYLEWAASRTDLAHVVLESDLDPLAILEGQMIVEGALVARPTLDLPATLDLALGETVTLTVPDPCTVSIDGATPVGVTGATLPLSGDVADSYALVIRAWPHLDATVTVRVGA